MKPHPLWQRRQKWTWKNLFNPNYRIQNRIVLQTRLLNDPNPPHPNIRDEKTRLVFLIANYSLQSPSQTTLHYPLLFLTRNKLHTEFWNLIFQITSTFLSPIYITHIYFCLCFTAHSVPQTLDRGFHSPKTLLGSLLHQIQKKKKKTVLKGSSLWLLGIKYQHNAHAWS